MNANPPMTRADVMALDVRRRPRRVFLKVDAVQDTDDETWNAAGDVAAGLDPVILARLAGGDRNVAMQHIYDGMCDPAMFVPGIWDGELAAASIDAAFATRFPRLVVTEADIEYAASRAGGVHCAIIRAGLTPTRELFESNLGEVLVRAQPEASG